MRALGSVSLIKAKNSIVTLKAPFISIFIVSRGLEAKKCRFSKILNSEKCDFLSFGGSPTEKILPKMVSKKNSNALKTAFFGSPKSRNAKCQFEALRVFF